MRINAQKFTILEVNHKEGISKANKPYSFYQLVIGDADFNRLPAEIGRGILVDGIVPDWMFKAAEKKAEVVGDIRVVPKGYDVKIVIEDIDTG